jgi:hypothetical protein
MQISRGPERWMVVWLCLVVAAILSLPASASAQGRERLGKKSEVLGKAAKTPIAKSTVKRIVTSQSSSESDGARLAQLLGLGQLLQPVAAVVPSADAALTADSPSRSLWMGRGSAAPALSGSVPAASGIDSASAGLGTTPAAPAVRTPVAATTPAVAAPAVRANVPVLPAPLIAAPAVGPANFGSPLAQPARDDSEVLKFGGAMHSSWTRPPKASPYR